MVKSNCPVTPGRQGGVYAFGWRIRTLACMAFLVACAGVFLIDSRVQRHRGRPRDRDEASRSDGSRAELDLRLAACDRVSQVRKRLARQVIAGQMSLLQAAGRYLDLNESFDDFSWEGFRTRFRGATDLERACRQVIEFVWCELSDDPRAGESATEKLEAELDSLLRNNKLRLDR
jgi:hypothetical protein